MAANPHALTSEPETTRVSAVPPVDMLTPGQQDVGETPAGAYFESFFSVNFVSERIGTHANSYVSTKTVKQKSP